MLSLRGPWLCSRVCVVHTQFNRIRIVWQVWYDLDSKLVRVDYRSPDKVPPLDTTHPLIEIHDFNYGTYLHFKLAAVLDGRLVN